MNKYAHLATLKTQIKELTAEAKTLEREIFQEVSDMDGHKLETDYATFSIMYRPRWKYSDELQLKEQQIKDKLKHMKQEEEVTGKAEKISDGGYLRTQVKHD